MTDVDSLAQSDAEPPRPDTRRILDRLRFCEDCLRSGRPNEYFGWAGDQPSLGELAQYDAPPRPDALAQSDAEPEWNCATQGCKNADIIDGLTGCAVKYRAKIKELEAALAQSNVGPDMVFRKMTGDYIEASRLKPTPPRPDASAGLIEAAEYLEKEINQYGGGDWQLGIKHGLKIAVRHLRRAADRSGK